MYSKFRLADAQAAKPLARRHRNVKSCTSCKSRKIRCDRGIPCTSCLTRDGGESCQYPNEPSNTKRARHQLGHVGSSVQTTENIPGFDLASCLKSGDETASPSKQHIGGAHWKAVLSQVHDVEIGPIVIGSYRDIGYSESLFDHAPPPSLTDILKALPTRPVVDRMLSVYFNAHYATLQIVHLSQFSRLYEAFSENPSGSSVIWVAQLFAILCISAELSAANSSESDVKIHKSHAHDFRKASAQCLILGSFETAQDHVIESLILYAQTKHMSNMEDTDELSVLLALAIRHAIRMGYHRDPRPSGHFSIFECEMRLRCWTVLCLLDTMTSLQLGTPRNIQADQQDATVALPSNVIDEDFDEMTAELPPERSIKAATPLLHLLSKRKLMRVIERILNKEYKAQPGKSETVSDLDRDLRAAYESLPACMKPKAIAQSYADDPALIVARIKIENLYRRSLCILHRASLYRPGASVDARKTCVEGAVLALHHLIELNDETQPGGQLCQAQWMFTTLGTSDTLFAAATLSLYISKVCTGTYRNNEEDDLSGKIALLHRTSLILAAQWPRSEDAIQVSEALKTLLADIGYEQTLDPTFDTPSFPHGTGKLPNLLPMSLAEGFAVAEDFWEATHDILDASNFTDWASN